MKLLHSKRFLSLSLFIIALSLWMMPTPEGLKPEAWHLFVIFFTTIMSIILTLLPIFTASILAVSFAILSNTMDVKAAYSGFDESFILLIIAAFLVARGVVKSGLGKRIALHIIKKFGSSTLGLGYSMVATDMIIAPAFPSNTARSGVLYPIVESLAHDSGSKIGDNTQKKMGSYLMMNSMAGIAISSSLWLTAMASNPVGAGIAAQMGVSITFGSWFSAAVVPALVAFITIPWLLYKIFPPQLKETPNAPTVAQKELDIMGKMSRNEWITGAVFISMVSLWALSATLQLDKTAIAFGGLGILMISKIFTMEDMKTQGDALSTLVWFAILYAMSSELNRLGFMNYIGEGIASELVGLSWQLVYVILVTLYVLIHYLFVSQTAHMLALFGVFLEVGLNAGVPGELLALMLLFATNFNSVITPQGSSANVLFAGSGYLSAADIYKNGGIVTLANTIIFLTIGTAWILLIS
ncbi:MAG: DASS family sodium-coupled anion symporter [Campylobacterota bacterium]|nr:DASS family sodium-coupled anion symporter [Campylobacterota bacterium]